MLAYLEKEGVITSMAQTGQRWRVRVLGTEWFAAVDDASALVIGDLVQVVGFVNATTLLVKRLEGNWK
ncbi:MAG: hypothetical protein KME07_09700 [Pegethrix bostrychoides GSE-TBD4-15B]|jgi:hypothetical protein|uniref:Uncharacterized protein n=1 Tax=Pegethrix bostrychoides GSE-TBD4-15B TaxID=2839662 RepID=A0A951PC02_9CYAN|nr:hypothetical protein [Pegethrix bostrychoides GSE-TBD4-15B]